MTRRGRPPKQPASRAHLGSPTTTEAPMADKAIETAQVETSAPEETKAPAKETESQRWARAEDRRDAYRGRLKALGAVGDQKLVAPTREGFRRYWGNDEGNRLAQLLNMGYDFVHKGSEGTENVFSDDPGDRISQLVGTQKNGGPLRAYLLEIPEGWYLENQETKEQSRRAVEKDLKRASHDGGSLRSSDGSSVAYIPEKGSSSHFDV